MFGLQSQSPVHGRRLTVVDIPSSGNGTALSMRSDDDDDDDDDDDRMGVDAVVLEMNPTLHEAELSNLSSSTGVIIFLAVPKKLRFHIRPYNYRLTISVKP